MSVTSIWEAARKLADARDRHPSAAPFIVHPIGLPDVSPSRGLVQIARRWDTLVEHLQTGVDPCTNDEAHELLQVMCAALVHQYARPTMVFQIPQLLAAVRLLDQVTAGDLDWHEAAGDCLTVEEAITDLTDDVLWLVYPLVHGRPIRDACRACRATSGNPDGWQTQQACTKHAASR